MASILVEERIRHTIGTGRHEEMEDEGKREVEKIVAAKLDAEKREADGRQLHREFVGMLFALAIAAGAEELILVFNSGIAWQQQTLPTYFHLALAITVIATSWVGWGRSKSSLSAIQDVFSWDFVELLTDVILVIIYFQIVSGAEMPQGDGPNKTVTPSLRNEASWIAVVFVIYFLWDMITKLGEKNDAGQRMLYHDPRNSKLIQRAWASAACMVLALIGYFWLRKESADASSVLIGDVGLLCLVLLFRAMKRKDLRDFKARNWRAIAMLLVVTLVCFEWSARRIAPRVQVSAPQLAPSTGTP